MRKIVLLIISTIIFLLALSGCSTIESINSNEESSSIDTAVKTGAVYRNKENGELLAPRSDGSFIMYVDNKYPVTAFGGRWENKEFFIDHEYVECPEPKYIFIRKGNESGQGAFTFDDDQWIEYTKLSPEKLYEDKINISEMPFFLCEYTIVDSELSSEEIITNSILQRGSASVGATYSNIFIFFENNAFRYYCSGYGAETKEDAEEYKNRIKYLEGRWEIKNNQIVLYIDKSEIKSGGYVKYDVISRFQLADYEITNELDGTTINTDFKIHIDPIDPRYESYIEIEGKKYYFISGYKLNNNNDMIDSFLEHAF